MQAAGQTAPWVDCAAMSRTMLMLHFNSDKVNRDRQIVEYSWRSPTTQIGDLQMGSLVCQELHSNSHNVSLLQSQTKSGTSIHLHTLDLRFRTNHVSDEWHDLPAFPPSRGRCRNPTIVKNQDQAQAQPHHAALCLEIVRKKTRKRSSPSIDTLVLSSPSDTHPSRFHDDMKRRQKSLRHPSSSGRIPRPRNELSASSSSSSSSSSAGSSASHVPHQERTTLPSTSQPKAKQPWEELGRQALHLIEKQAVRRPPALLLSCSPFSTASPLPRSARSTICSHTLSNNTKNSNACLESKTTTTTTLVHLTETQACLPVLHTHISSLNLSSNEYRSIGPKKGRTPKPSNLYAIQLKLGSKLANWCFHGECPGRRRWWREERRQR